MDIVLRNEKESDYEIVEDLTREAFWNLHAPGCDEHYLVHTLRHRSEFVPELDYVAVIDDKVVDNIMYVKTTIISSDNKNLYDVITFGPLSVLPKYQKMGIGRKLIEFTKIKAAKMGFNAILIYGDPLYYSRFGF